ncbi:AT-rich interactive domain-containing protein 3A isoform X2 [Echeneis naucrates]|uniref:AT-rich interactive domain-containing protein 3A isoform X2 n=1 Tax=Echeneis naucrates TaxID=173247 RepID=UPI001113A54F|nr:AT-rich interactive domain-containing protein 3A isoform X2 [Echeneis naucrates]
MKLQAVMENLHRQQRAKLLMEQQLQQAAQGRTAGGDESMGSPAPEAEQAQMAALAAMRAAAAGLRRVSDSPMSERSSGGEEEGDDDDDNEEEEEQYKDMMGSDEEEQIKQKWDEDDFEGEMEEDYDDDLAEEGLPTEHDAVTPGKGIFLLPHRQLHPHSQLLKARPSVDQEPRVAILPPHATHSHAGGQDHGDWTYEEQFRQLYELDGDPKRKEFLDDLFSFMQKRGTPVNRIPIMAKQVLDLYMLYRLVTEKGGLVEVINKKLWREITKGLNLPTSITSAAFTLRTQYMKYLYPYECDKRGLSNPNELQAAIDSNRREGRRQSFGSSLFTYSPNGTPTMLSSPKLPTPNVGLTVGTNGASLTPIQKVKKRRRRPTPSRSGRGPSAGGDLGGTFGGCSAGSSSSGSDGSSGGGSGTTEGQTGGWRAPREEDGTAGRRTPSIATESATTQPARHDSPDSHEHPHQQPRRQTGLGPESHHQQQQQHQYVAGAERRDVHRCSVCPGSGGVSLIWNAWDDCLKLGERHSSRRSAAGEHTYLNLNLQ